MSGGGPQEGRIVAAFFFVGCKGKASQLRKLRLCSRLLRAYCPRKSIGTAEARSPRWRRMAIAGDCGTRLHACRPHRTFRGRARSRPFHFAARAISMDGRPRVRRRTLRARRLSRLDQRDDGARTIARVIGRVYLIF